jgi:hypothetical protein
MATVKEMYDIGKILFQLFWLVIIMRIIDLGVMVAPEKISSSNRTLLILLV